MRKFVVVIPFIAISLLSSCNNGGDKPDPAEYTLTLTLNDCNVNGKSTYSKKYAKGLTIDDVIVSPNADYVLKDDSVNDTYKQYWSASTEGSYVLSGLTMNSNYDITITASSITPPEPTKYVLEVNCAYCTPSGNLSTYATEADVLFTITPDKDYKLPEKEGINVTGVNDYEYTVTSGVATFSCTMPANKVTVTVTATPVTPPEPTGTWTLKLDDDSAKYGVLQYKTQVADSITIDDFIGETSAITMTFIPGDDYKTIQFTITATAEEGSAQAEDYVPPTGIYMQASFSLQKAEGFADGDVITLHFIEPEPPVTGYSISMITDGTTISPTTMDVGEAYDGTITVTNSNKILDGADSLKSVKLKTSEEDITSYCTDYDPSDDYKTATFTIPAEYITDDIEVEVSLKDKPAEVGTVFWYDENGIDLLEMDTNVPIGETPHFNKPIPYKEKDANYAYRFSGWNPELHPVTKEDNIYKAVYEKVSLAYLRANMKINIPETSSELTFGFAKNGTKEITVDWGDKKVNSDISHTYDKGGIYNISIYGEDITSINAGFDSSHASRTYLTEIQLQEGITSISDFVNCANLTSISIPSSIASIKNDAFTSCNNLVYETYDKCKYLGNDNNKYQVVMGPCEKTITTTSLHENCTVIKDAAFNVSQLASIVIPNGILSIPMNAFHGTKLTSVTIPNSVTSIGEFAFESCVYLKSVYIDISSNLENIEMYAFYSCTALETVVIPPSVKNIDKKAFGNVTSLQEVDLSGFDTLDYEDLPILGEDAFSKYPSSVSFYVKDEQMRALFIMDDVHGWDQINDDLFKVKPPVNNL